MWPLFEARKCAVLRAQPRCQLPLASTEGACLSPAARHSAKSTVTMDASPVLASLRRSSIPAPSSGRKAEASQQSGSHIPASPGRTANNSPFIVTQSPLCKEKLRTSPQMGCGALAKSPSPAKECPSASKELAPVKSTIPAYADWADENMQTQCDDDNDPVARLFWQDAEFVHMCEDGLTRGLTRTKDGGRKDKELAALVKTLRKCVRGYNERLAQLQQNMQHRASGAATQASPGETAMLRSKLATAEDALAQTQAGVWPTRRLS